MMKLKQLAAMFLAFVLAVSMTACGGAATASGSAGGKPTKKPEDMKVALVMLGAISDLGWDYTASVGLGKIGKMGPQTSYKEKVEMSDLESVFRTYATEGYDVIFYATSMGEEAVETVAKDFPDTQFIVIAGNLMTDNICSVKMADEQQGYMLGAIAALASETDTVGFVGANEIVPVVNGLKGFEQGAKAVNPNVEVLSTFTGSDFDVNLAKEVATAMIDQGAGAMSSIATAGTVGVLEACTEHNIPAVSESAGLAEGAPAVALTSVIKDASIGYEVIFQRYLDGDLPTEIIKMGAKEGVVYLEPWNDQITVPGLTDDEKAQIDQIYKDMSEGTITIDIS